MTDDCKCGHAAADHRSGVLNPCAIGNAEKHCGCVQYIAKSADDVTRHGGSIREFEHDVEKLINRCSLENGSDTPDFILAAYLRGCLENYNRTLKAREQWFGRGPWTPTDNPQQEPPHAIED